MYRPLIEKKGHHLSEVYCFTGPMGTKREHGEGMAYILDLDSGTLTPLLKRMEVNRLIRQERSKFESAANNGADVCKLQFRQL
ncbi:hypothetical protein SAMN04487897_10335 [Paenibacillus sp. yr247]|nr:hypothetical protein SAMN04487897_10335 [Paenibacillus sp. yr247]